MIHITKSGFKRFEWRASLRRYAEEEFEPLTSLRESVVEVEEGVTLGDILTFVACDESLSAIVSCYSGCSVSGIYSELQKAAAYPAFDSVAQKVEYCTVSTQAEIVKINELEHGKILNLSTDFHGCGSGIENWALDLCPLAEIAPLPFRLKDNASVAHVADSGYALEDKLHHVPTLLSLLDAIFFDLSLFGSEDEKTKSQFAVLSSQ